MSGPPKSKAKSPATHSPEIVRFLEHVKNNVAIDLTAYPAKVFLLFDGPDAKNILATAELILISAFPKQ